MKSTKFIQFFDAEDKPILSDGGIINYDKRSKQIWQVRQQLKKRGKIPTGATHFAIHKTILKSIVKLTQRYEL